MMLMILKWRLKTPASPLWYYQSAFQCWPDGEGSVGVVGSRTQAVSQWESCLACLGVECSRNIKMAFLVKAKYFGFFVVRKHTHTHSRSCNGHRGCVQWENLLQLSVSLSASIWLCEGQVCIRYGIRYIPARLQSSPSNYETTFLLVSQH